MIIKSKKFILRDIRRSDKNSLIKNINNQEIYKYTLRIPFPYTSKDWDKWIKHCLAARRNKRPKEINFVIDIDGEVAGGIGLMNIEVHKAEIGYWLGKKYWGKGIMTEAVKIMTNFGFNKLKLKRTYAPIFPENTASKRVLEKNNYKLEGKARNYHIKKGKLVDALIYSKVR